MNTTIDADCVPAEILVTVTKFRAVLSPKEARTLRNVEYRMETVRAHPRVELRDNTIVVRAPGADIRLTIAAAAKNTITYYPAGITFVREDGDDLKEALRLGHDVFPQRRIVIEGPSLTFTDWFKRGKANVRYKFSVILQRGSDGAIGIVDPGIENDSQH